MNQDITSNHFYVRKLIGVSRVLESTPRRNANVKSRHCDAIVYALSGCAIYRFDDGLEFTVREGDIMYMARNAVYSVTFPTQTFNILFCDFEFDSSVPKQSAVFTPKNTLHAKSLFEKLLHVYTASTQTSFHDSMALFYEIYSLIRTSSNQEYVAPSARRRVTEVKTYIDEHYKDPALSVESLSERAQMSEVYLRKLFRAQYDISPSQYITSVRLKKAKELMRSPFLTLEECALQSGFSSPQYFCRVFKKETGTTPYTFRKQL